MKHSSGQTGPSDSPILHAAIGMVSMVRNFRDEIEWERRLPAVIIKAMKDAGPAVYETRLFDRCLRNILTMNQHVIATLRTYQMAGRLLLGLQPLKWLF
jgi:hypothetical protein